MKIYFTPDSTGIRMHSPNDLLKAESIYNTWLPNKITTYIFAKQLTYLLFIDTAKLDRTGLEPTHRKNPPFHFMT